VAADRHSVPAAGVAAAVVVEGAVVVEAEAASMVFWKLMSGDEGSVVGSAVMGDEFMIPVVGE